MPQIEAVGVRTYRAADLDACRLLWVQLTEHHRTIYDSPQIGGHDPGARFDEHLESVGSHRLWVAEVDGRVVGLTGVIVDGSSGEIEPMIVDRRFRRAGVGRALFEAVVTYAHAQGLRELSARPTGRNAAALAFFRSMGLGTIGHVEVFSLFGSERRWVPGATVSGVDFDV